MRAMGTGTRGYPTSPRILRGRDDRPPEVTGDRTSSDQRLRLESRELRSRNPHCGAALPRLPCYLAAESRQARRTFADPSDNAQRVEPVTRVGPGSPGRSEPATRYTSPRASMASATWVKPATLAPTR